MDGVGGGGVFQLWVSRRRKLRRMKRGKVYCLQLPPDAPTLRPLWQYWHQMKTNQKRPKLEFCPKNCFNTNRKTGIKIVLKVFKNVKPQSRLEAKLEQGRGVETELGMVRRYLYISVKNLSNLYLHVWCVVLGLLQKHVLQRARGFGRREHKTET